MNDEMYTGRLVWNRLRYANDPETGKRRSRANENDAIITIDALELAVVPQEVWNAVKARQATLGKSNLQKLERTGGETDNETRPSARRTSTCRPADRALGRRVGRRRARGACDAKTAGT
jgi:hypothetical protein